MPHAPGLSPETPHQGCGAGLTVELVYQVGATTAENFGADSIASLLLYLLLLVGDGLEE